MTGENAAPAEMPGVEEIARAIYERRNGHGCKPWSLLTKAHKEPYLGDAEAAHALFAPILAEKERAELALCELMNAAGHYKATHSEIDREALSATIKAAADHFAAAIRAEGE